MILEIQMSLKLELFIVTINKDEYGEKNRSWVVKERTGNSTVGKIWLFFSNTMNATPKVW